MLKRYGEVMLRLEELGARAGRLNNSDRNELQSLLEEQAWLGTTMVKKAKSVLEEIDGSFEKLFDWMIDISDLIDHAASAAGTPEDLLALENIMGDVVKLKDQMKQLNLDKRITHAVTKRAGNLLLDARFEAAPATAPLRVDAQSVAVANLVDVNDCEQTYIPETVDPLPEVSASTGGPAQKKSHKKKAKKAKYLTGQYQPPQELLVSIAEKISPPTQLKLLEDAGQFISLDLPGTKK